MLSKVSELVRFLTNVTFYIVVLHRVLGLKMSVCCATVVELSGADRTNKDAVLLDNAI